MFNPHSTADAACKNLFYSQDPLHLPTSTGSLQTIPEPVNHFLPLSNRRYCLAYREIFGLLNKSRRAKELMPQVWAVTWQGPPWGWDSETHVLDLPLESTCRKQLYSFPCLTVPLLHCASRDHLPANFLHQNPDPKVHLGGNLTNTPHSSSSLCLRVVLGMLGAPSSHTLGHASKTQQPPPSHTPLIHIYHAAITFLKQLFNK